MYLRALGKHLMNTNKVDLVPEDLVLVPDHPLCKDLSPNVQSELPLVQL